MIELLAHTPTDQLAPHIEEARLLGVKLLNVEDFLELLVRFGINAVATGFAVGAVYYPRTRRADYAFTYGLISVAVFLLCFLLAGVKLELGFALGLFAIFGIIRYRTDPVPIKEMTYLFVIIAVAVFNALSNKKVSYAELALANLAIVGLLGVLEMKWLPRQTSQKSLTYDRIELARPDRHAELVEDLRLRTGLDVCRVDVKDLNFLRDTAELIIHYRTPGQPGYEQPAQPKAAWPAAEADAAADAVSSAQHPRSTSAA